MIAGPGWEGLGDLVAKEGGVVGVACRSPVMMRGRSPRAVTVIITTGTAATAATATIVTPSVALP